MSHEYDALVRFARRTAHDINNFSTVVRSYSELMLADLPAGEAMHDDVQEIQRAADATVRYLQRVSLFARVSQMRRLHLSLEEGITDGVAAFVEAHPSRPVTCHVEGGSVMAEAQWWRTVVMELLQNAHEAAPAGTTISIRCAVTDGLVTMEMEDAGAGVPDALRETATAPFVTGKDGVRGAGMGLAIVDAFVRTVGGQLSLTRRSGMTVVALVMPDGARAV